MKKNDILLCTLNSTYQHSSFGLRYLYANLGNDLQPRAQIIEWTIKENPFVIVEKILQCNPRIVGFGIYIWNTKETLEVLNILKKVSPEIIVVLGGPEISYETESQPHIQLADYIIKGEADFAFRELCETILIGNTIPNIIPNTKIITSSLPDIKKIIMPYELYSDSDIENRVLYVEASRGCPYKCEYCLSSLDKSVRNFEIELFLQHMQTLLDRGARTFKFVDRTFNLSPSTSTAILKFFLQHIQLGLFLHFELVPDRLPLEIRELIQQFPMGSLQFEVGIQTLNPQVAFNVSRKNDLTKVAENFKFIKEFTHVHTHADLIVGLPGETLQSFADGFDQLNLMGPDEIQVGILKRLKGTPIARHEVPFQMLYSNSSPYQILSTAQMNFFIIQKMVRFAKFWDLYANSGEFKNFITWIKNTQFHLNHLIESQSPGLSQNNSSSFGHNQEEKIELQPNENSFFGRFFELSLFLKKHFQETHSISLIHLAEKAWLFIKEKTQNDELAYQIIEQDYCYSVKRRDLPPFLKKNSLIAHSQLKNSLKNKGQHRQQNHLLKNEIIPLTSKNETT